MELMILGTNGNLASPHTRIESGCWYSFTGLHYSAVTGSTDSITKSPRSTQGNSVGLLRNSGRLSIPSDTMGLFLFLNTSANGCFSTSNQYIMNRKS